ncbi:hypothetical protein [Tabrizicola sp.]|uniref:hypothetical protein n=1 Tax=Tabrizicola sp. TaxID=2005166 RepID=UPI003F3864E7
MIFTRPRLGLASLVLASALPATATPPDVIDVHDELFGVSPSHIFLLRSALDNLGSYYMDRSETMLVAVELATGAETLWPVYTMNRGLVDDGTDSERSKVVVSPRQDAVNPFDILAEYDAVPAAAAFPRADADAVPDAKLGADALSVSYSATDGSYALATETLLSGMTASINRLAEAVGDYERPLHVTSARDLLLDRAFAVQECSVSDPLQLSALIEAAPIQLVRITCSSEEDFSLNSLIVVVPDATK